MDGEAKHATQLLDAFRTFFLIQVDDGFGVAIGAEAVPLGYEVAPQFLIVVNLAVEDDPNGAILIRNRLVTSVQIDDAEAAHPDGASALDPDTFIVWTAMNNGVTHRPDVIDLSRLIA